MNSKWKPSKVGSELQMTRCVGQEIEVRKMLWLDKCKTFFSNLTSAHHRIMVRFLRKRNWVVFYLEPKHRVCPKGSCWLELYNNETMKQ